MEVCAAGKSKRRKTAPLDSACHEGGLRGSAGRIEWCGQSPLFCGLAWLRGPALPRPNEGLLYQSDETCPGSLAVLSLCAMFPAVEYEHALDGHAATGKRDQASFDIEGQRRLADVEAQLNGGGDLVHVLPARS